MALRWQPLLSRAGIFAGALYFMKISPGHAELQQAGSGGIEEFVGRYFARWHSCRGNQRNHSDRNRRNNGHACASTVREAVAGFGVASRVESMTLVFFYAMSAIIGPFVGQNISAGKADRIYLALKTLHIFLSWFRTGYCRTAWRCPGHSYHRFSATTRR